MTRHNTQIRAQQFTTLMIECLLNAISKKTDRGHTSNSDNDGDKQDTQFSSPPVPAQHA